MLMSFYSLCSATLWSATLWFVAKLLRDALARGQAVHRAMSFYWRLSAPRRSGSWPSCTSRRPLLYIAPPVLNASMFLFEGPRQRSLLNSRRVSKARASGPPSMPQGISIAHPTQSACSSSASNCLSL